MQSLSNLSIASLTVPYLSNISITFCYLSVFSVFAALSTSSKILKLLTPVAVLLFLVTTGFGYLRDITNKNFEAYFLDSGTRNTVFIKTDAGKNILINGGISRFNQKGFAEKYVITSFLLKSGISRIDYIILTESSKDILEGTAHLLGKFDAQYLWTNGSKLSSGVWEEIKDRNIKWKDIQRGYEPLYIGKTKIELPFRPSTDNRRYGNNKVLVTINHENLNIVIGDNFSTYNNISAGDKNISDSHKKKIIYSPYLKNSESLDNLVQFYNPHVLITKDIGFNYSKPQKTEIYEITNQGMIKVVSNNKSLKLAPTIDKYNKYFIILL